MKLLFNVCILLLLFGQIHADQSVAQNTADYHLAVYRMNEMMYFDVEMRIQIVKHYMRMWKNSLYYDIGIVGASIRTHFRYMLKLYRYHSNPRLLQYKGYGLINWPLYYQFNAFGWNIEHWSRGFVMMLLEYTKIMGNIREFFVLVKKYLKQQRYWRKVRKQATYIHGWADLRRHNAPSPSTESTTLPDEEYEVDYFGHKFRKGQKFPTGGVDLEKKVDSMLESEKAINELLGVGIDDGDDDLNFTQINEWIKYMKASGIEEKVEEERKRQQLKKKEESGKKQKGEQNKAAKIKQTKKTNQNVAKNQKAKQNKRAENGQMPRNQNRGKTRNPTLAKTQNGARTRKTAGNQKALNNQKTAGNQKALNNQKTTGNQKALNNQKTAGNQKALNNQKTAPNQKALNNQKTAPNQKALDNQRTLEDQTVSKGFQSVPKKINRTIPKSHKPTGMRPKRGQRDADFEYKEGLRRKFADQMRGNFDPEREGIQIDLSGLN